MQESPSQPDTQPATQAAGPTGASGPTGLIAKTGQAADKAIGYVERYGPDVLTVFLIMFASWVLAGWARRTARRGLERAHFDLTLSKFLSNMVRWIILAVAVIMCLGRFGIQTASFAALIGAAGLAIGLGFQGSLSNMAAGVMLLVFRPFKVGDGIAVGGTSGSVNEIDLFTTLIDTADGRRIIMPNGAIFGSVIENTTHHPRRRVDVAVAVAGPHEVEAVRAVLVLAARGTPGVLPDPAAEAVVLDMVGNWSVQAWAKTGEAGAVRQAIIKSLKHALAQAGFGGPRPVMDVTVTGLSDVAKAALRG